MLFFIDQKNKLITFLCFKMKKTIVLSIFLVVLSGNVLGNFHEPYMKIDEQQEQRPSLSQQPKPIQQQPQPIQLHQQPQLNKQQPIKPTQSFPVRTVEDVDCNLNILYFDES